MELEGRVALVTGAATGIGRATALALAAAGAAGVVVTYRSAASAAAEAVEAVRARGAEALAVQADVRDDGAVRAMVAQVERRFGRLDVLVNNAGTTRWIPLPDLEALTDEVWQEILDVNLLGAFRCTRAAAPLLAEAGGVVVNVASVSGVLAPATMSSIPYGVAKAGLVHLTRLLAVALAPRVRVNAVAPAFTDTGWMRDHFGEAYAETVERAAARYPLRRIATPEDVAAAILGLVRGGDFVTGQTLLVDGGLSLE
ncbi:MAG: SDR family oxidoreductase [Armatimonadota bacterium]|nr:SDR family oxidoreductase [Armatimonadota bacterium]MDR7449376.1 SDR family oxidoreductase [Armatimonadota bacterium]MDR7458339.1 SDR family oxidoreductase [Armatimonadota bacterium]MDR7478856.1 SDR family oxidoreductase [Armatimonadota bacterium]MDR7488742.1 SDR family oxidoreductase [Armatimonadota bacterium]